MTPDEQRLRGDVAVLKRAAPAAPPFETMWRRPAPARRRWPVMVPLSSIAAAAMLLLVCRVERRSAAPSTVAAAAPALMAPVALEPAPLDFLLDTAGRNSRSLALDSRSMNPIRGW